MLVSRPGSFIPEERTPGTRWIGGWLDPTAVAKRKQSLSLPGIQPLD